MGLGDLKKQLLKAGLVDEKQVRRVEHDERAARKAKGREALEVEQQAKKERLESEAKQRREADRKREQERQKEQAGRAQQLRLAQIAQSAAVRPQGRPSRRWYYVSRSGCVPYVPVDEPLGGRLESGSVVLVESSEGETWLVDREAAERIREADADWIRS